MIIAVDVDGILADLLPEWLRRYNADYNDRLAVSDVTVWDTHTLVKPECGFKIYDYLTDPSLYDAVEALPGSQYGVERLRQLGHELIFATSNSFGMTDPKARWMIRKGFLPAVKGTSLPREYVPIKDKWRLQADLLIDDGGHNVSAWVQTRRRAIMLETSHNQSLDLPSMFYSWILRAKDWADIINYVEEIS